MFQSGFLSPKGVKEMKKKKKIELRKGKNEFAAERNGLLARYFFKWNYLLVSLFLFSCFYFKWFLILAGVGT